MKNCSCGRNLEFGEPRSQQGSAVPSDHYLKVNPATRGLLMSLGYTPGQTDVLERQYRWPSRSDPFRDARGKPLVTVTNHDRQMQARVVPNISMPGHFNISFRDLISGQALPIVPIVAGLDASIEKATELVGLRCAKNLLSGPEPEPSDAGPTTG